MSADPLHGPVVLAVASGKGGVGKTMLTVACAYELSLSVPTLVIDLDFFNRGLSGLLHERREAGLVARPRYLDAADAPPARPWRVVEVEDRLFHVAYPDLLPDELVRLEGRSVQEICGHLREFIADAAKICGCKAVVLDCHGGPDHTSFAATVLAEHTLLVSEPDRITLHGTLNFLRQSRRAADQRQCDVRLVFNKVISAFRPRFLKRVYRDLLAPEFDNKPLLAVFPLELPLTKAFEETPILTAVYPYSLLAIKIRVLLRDLFGERHPELLTRASRALPGFVVRRQRKTLGKVWWFLNTSVPLATLVIGAMVAIPLYTLTQMRFESFRANVWRAEMIVAADQHPEIAVAHGSQDERIIKYPLRYANTYSLTSYDPASQTPSLQPLAAEVATGMAYTSASKMTEAESVRDALLQKWPTLQPGRFGEEWKASLEVLRPHFWDKVVDKANDFTDTVIPLVMVGLIAWLATAFYIQWSVTLDRGFTYAARRGANIMMVVYLLAALLIWQLPSYLIASIMQITNGDRKIFLPVSIGLMFVIATVILSQGYLIYRDLRYQPHWRESCGRMVFLLLLPTAGLAVYFSEVGS